jgi:hypothetical protein
MAPMTPMEEKGNAGNRFLGRKAERPRALAPWEWEWWEVWEWWGDESLQSTLRASDTRLLRTLIVGGHP